MSLPWSRLRTPIVIGLLVIIAGCSATQFFYNRAHVFIPWYVDDYVSLNAAQDDRLEALLRDFTRQHRREHLPRYIDLIDQLLAALSDPLTRRELTSIYDRVEDELNRLQEDALSWMLALGETLSEQQIAEFLDNMREQQRDYEEQYLDRDREAYERESYERLKDIFGDYMGHLQKAQRQVLKRSVRRLHRADSEWLELRRYRIERLSEILQRRPGWQAEVRDLMARPLPVEPGDYRAAFRANRSILLDATVTVINTRSERQDERLRNRLRDLREDLVELHARADAG